MSEHDLCAFCGRARFDHDEGTFVAENDISGMTAEQVEEARSEHDR